MVFSIATIEIPLSGVNRLNGLKINPTLSINELPSTLIAGLYSNNMKLTGTKLSDEGVIVADLLKDCNPGHIISQFSPFSHLSEMKENANSFVENDIKRFSEAL